MRKLDVLDWIARASKHLRAEDFLAFSPPGAVATALYFAWERLSGRERPDTSLDAFDESFHEVMMDFARELGTRWFRWKVYGAHRVPANGPCLLVGNHNGTLFPIDSLLTLCAVHDAHGSATRTYSLSHDIVHAVPRFRELANKMGVLRAGHTGGAEALRRGHRVLVYPGSDYDACRAFADRGRIELAGRKGFLKLALREQVPIVPVVSTGTHEQLIVLTRGDALAKLIQTRRWLRSDVFPIVLSLPWGLTSGFLPYIPLPAQTSLSFGDPISWPELTPDDAQDPEVLERCYRDVEQAMQHRLDELMRGRIAWIGQPDHLAPTDR